MNKYDINLHDYEDKKAIGYYNILCCNACYNAIMIIDVVYKYGDYVIIYRGDSSNEKCNRKLRYARLRENNIFTAIDCFGYKHNISYNQCLRIDR